MSSACTSPAVLDLRQHQLVEPLRRALDDLDHVAVRPLGVPHVDAHAQDGVAPVERVDRVDDLAARGRLLERRDRVLEVEEHHVGAEDRAPCRASSRSSPGTERHERRGRLRERSDMAEGYRAEPMVARPNPAPCHELADGVFVWLQPGGESGVSNAGVDRRRRRHHRDRHAHGAVAVGAVRGRGRQARPAGAAARAHARARRPRRRHAGRSRTRSVLGSPQTSELLDGEMPRRRVQGVHARVRRRSSTSSPSSAPAR